MGNGRDRFKDGLDPFGGIHRLGKRLRDDYGNWFSDVSHDINGENRMRCDEKPGTVAIAERHLVWVRGHRAVRDRPQAISRRVSARQHDNHAWPIDRVCDVDLSIPSRAHGMIARDMRGLGPAG